jgi:hypothetical protein
MDDVDIVGEALNGLDMHSERTAAAALARLAQDAARYRHLRGKDLDTIQWGGVFAGMTPDNFVLNGEDLDREVDAEMRR